MVFNDLDWVPTNHWQAEDRAYRIGQTRTVNVTYFVARDTIDDFVQAVLETKAALVNAIVEGDALAPGSGGDVLDELQRVLHAISAGGDVAAGHCRCDAWIPRLLRRASEEFRTMHRAAPHRPAAIRGEREVQALARALEALVKVLSGPSARRFRISSTSHTGVDYEIVVVGRRRDLQLPGVRGTLDLLILRTLLPGPSHGHAIAEAHSTDLRRPAAGRDRLALPGALSARGERLDRRVVGAVRQGQARPLLPNHRQGAQAAGQRTVEMGRVRARHGTAAEASR